MAVDRHATKLLLLDRLYLFLLKAIFWQNILVLGILRAHRHHVALDSHRKKSPSLFLDHSGHCLIYILHSDQFSWQSIFSVFLQADANVPLLFLYLTIKLLWLQAARPKMLFFPCFVLQTAGTCISRSTIDSVRLSVSLSQDRLMARFFFLRIHNRRNGEFILTETFGRELHCRSNPHRMHTHKKSLDSLRIRQLVGTSF